MSRIGRQLIVIPQGVMAAVADASITVSGPKGTLKRSLDHRVSVEVSDESIRVAVKNPDDKKERAIWGTTASHIKNMVEGVVSGFKKQLEINGVGYRVALQGSDLKFEVGYSHPVLFPVPTGISTKVEKNIITLEGMDIELLGKTAAKIRNIRKPEPYKGKGIKYVDEVIRRKAGKAATKSAA